MFSPVALSSPRLPGDAVVELTHTFTVAASMEQTWAALNDIESVAGCFPGAAITSAQGDSFAGTCKVKLRPVALVYNGSGTFVEKDETAHTMKIEAKGKDKRGNGTAGAHIAAALSDVGGQTSVQVVTDLAITGRPAQFGRGVMQDVSDKLLGQFVTCLQNKVGADTVTQADTPTSEPARAVPDPSGPDVPMAPPIPTPEQPAPHSVVPAATQNDALDLGVAVLPALVRAYWKPVLAVGATLGVIVYVATR